MKNKTSFHKFMESQAINVELGAIDEVKRKRDAAASEIVKLASKMKADAKLFNDYVGDLEKSIQIMETLIKSSKELGADAATNQLETLKSSTNGLAKSWGSAIKTIVSTLNKL